jgi:hypothetical protein
MNWEAIGAIGQVVGAFGVIASLLYLAAQIREEAKAKRASAVHSQAEAFRGLLHTLATDGELSAIYLRGIRDFGSLRDSELVRFASTLGYFFRVLEEAHFHWTEGNIDPHVWHGFEMTAKDILAYSGVRDWWSTRGHWYNQPFQEFVHARIVERGAPKLYGEIGA